MSIDTADSAHRTLPPQMAPKATILRLEGWAALRAEGPDAETFLQGQLSADLRKLAPDGALWGGYNSPKGRLLAVPLLLRADTAIELWLPAALLEPVLRRLKMFVLRSRLSLADARAGRAALGVLGADAAGWLASHGLPVPSAPMQLATGERFQVLRAAGADARYLVFGAPAELAALAPEAPAETGAWRRADIHAGIPVIYPETQDRWVAQMANLDLLGGVSFDKGCYTGQEVVARLHYLGNLKKRLFRIDGTGIAPAPGNPIHDEAADGQAVGEIVDAVADGEAFSASAVLQLVRRESAGLRLHTPDGPALGVPQAYPGVLAPPA